MFALIVLINFSVCFANLNNVSYFDLKEYSEFIHHVSIYRGSIDVSLLNPIVIENDNKPLTVFCERNGYE